MDQSENIQVVQGYDGPDVLAAYEERLSLKEKLSYGIGDVSGNMVNLGVNMFYNAFLTNVAGINAGVVGVMQLISRVFDGVTDFISGLLVDKTKSKEGKCRPWLARFAIPFMICYTLLFYSPSANMNVKIIWAFVTYNLVVSGVFTFTQTPYGALAARMTNIKEQRDQLGLFRMVSQVIVNFVVAGYSMKIVELLGGGRSAWMITFGVYGIFAGLSLLVTYKGTKERLQDKDVLEKKKEQDKKADWTSIKALFKNKYWVIQLLSSLLQALDTLSGNVMMYFLMYVMMNTGYLTWFGYGSGIMAFGLFVVAPFALKYVGKKYMAMSNYVAGAVLALLLWMNPTSGPVFIAMALIKPFFAVGNATTRYTMLADAADYGEWKTGIRNEGLIFAAASLGNKVGQGIASGLSMILLGLAGYVSATNGAEVVQPDSAVKMIIFLFCVTPLIINICGIILMSMWDLDKRYDQIAADLKERHMVANRLKVE